MAYGTLSVSDLLASTRQTVAEIGEDDAFAAIDQSLKAHNQLLSEEVADFVETSTDRQRSFGGPDSMTMDELDEYGRADAEKATAGITVGFPLRKFGKSIQWTKDYFRRKSAKEFAEQFVALQAADAAAIRRELARALFYTSNYTYRDRYVDNVDLAVKRLVNADSAAIPLGPNGESFDGATHTHFLGTGSFAASDIDSLVETVIEHHNVGEARIYINRAQETTVRGFTSNSRQFTPYLDVKLVGADNAVKANGTLDQSNLYNRAIGVWGNSGAEVWVKPWVPANYLFATIIGAPKPLVYRYDPVVGNMLEMVADDEAHPLRARSFERYFGFGAWTRTNGAALYISNATYSQPTIS